MMPAKSVKLAHQAAIDFLKSWLPYRFRQTPIPGLSVAISYQGNVMFSAAYGVEDLESKRPLGADSLFAVASQSKMFAVVSVMQLVEQGKLCLDDPLWRHLPWLADHPDPRMKEITIRQLLSHSAGLAREMERSDFWELRADFPDTEQIRPILLKLPIVIEPNTKLKYSNAAYALVGLLVQQVGRCSYQDYVRKNIIEKLKLGSTYADYQPDLRVTAGYGTFVRRPCRVFDKSLPTNAFAPVVGVHSTAADMSRFISAIDPNCGSLLGPALVKEITRTQSFIGEGYDAGAEFGLGVEIVDSEGHRLVGHSGHFAGHLSATFYDAKCQLAVSVLANCKEAPSPQIATGIFGVLHYFLDNAASETPPRLSCFNARLLSPLATVQIVATAGQIVAIDPDDWQPFNFIEQLEVISPNVLRVVTEGSIFNEAELLKFRFSHGQLRSVRFVGSELLPEEFYSK